MLSLKKLPIILGVKMSCYNTNVKLIKINVLVFCLFPMLNIVCST